MNQETAALICRVSTREQEEGYSLDAQESLLREFCIKNRLDALIIHRFSETASKHARRQKFHAFMKEVAKRKVRHIVVEKVDRLSRSGLREAVLIDDWLEADEVRHLHCVKDGIDLHKYARSGDKLNWGMRVVLAKNYTDNLREEVRKSTDAMLRKGIWPAKTPKGYIRDKSNAQCPIQPDPVRAPLIQLLFDLYDSGDWSVHRLEERMFMEGYRTARDTRLKVSEIHGMLHDPFYMGKMLFEGKLYEGVHSPLISATQFYRVQKRLTREGHGEGAAPFQKHEHLFRRLVFCGGCGGMITWEVQKGHVYGYCRNKKTCTARASIRQDALEKKLIPRLDAFRLESPRVVIWLRQVLLEMNADEAARREASHEELERSLARVEQRLSRLMDLRIDDSISENDFTRKRAELTQEKDLVLERLHRVSEHQDSFLDSIATLIELTQSLSSRFVGLPDEAKRVVIQQVFQCITVTEKQVKIEYVELMARLLKALQAVNSSKFVEFSGNDKLDFELAEIGSGKQKRGTSTPSHSAWWTILNEFRTFFCTDDEWQNFMNEARKFSAHEIETILNGLGPLTAR